MTGSLLFYAPVCCLDFVRGCCLAVLIVSGLLDEDYFSAKLVVPWDAPEAVVDLHSDGVVERFRTLLAWLVGGRGLQYVGF